MRQAGPRLLNPELESDKGLSGGRGRGRAGRGQSWAGPGRPLPLQCRSQTLCEWRGPAGVGREEGRGGSLEPANGRSERQISAWGLERFGQGKGRGLGDRKRKPRRTRVQKHSKNRDPDRVPEKER